MSHAAITLLGRIRSVMTDAQAIMDGKKTGKLSKREHQRFVKRLAQFIPEAQDNLKFTFVEQYTLMRQIAYVNARLDPNPREIEIRARNRSF